MRLVELQTVQANFDALFCGPRKILERRFRRQSVVEQWADASKGAPWAAVQSDQVEDVEPGAERRNDVVQRVIVLLVKKDQTEDGDAVHDAHKDED